MKTSRLAGAETKDGSIQVLVAEDNRVNQLLAKKLLKSSGCVTVTANNGQLAIDALMKQPTAFDLVLMDCQMPVMDGYEATERIRELQSNGALPMDLPVIAVTGLDATQVDAGLFDDILTKPFRSHELTAMVAQHTAKCEQLPKTPGNSSPWQPFSGDVLLDVCAGEVEVAAALLQTFVENGNTCVTQMRNAIAANDFTAARAAGHSLKGAAGMLAATAVFELAKQIEDFDANSSADQLESLIDQLSIELKRCGDFEFATTVTT